MDFCLFVFSLKWYFQCWKFIFLQVRVRRVSRTGLYVCAGVPLCAPVCVCVYVCDYFICDADLICNAFAFCILDFICPAEWVKILIL